MEIDSEMQRLRKKTQRDRDLGQGDSEIYGPQWGSHSEIQRLSGSFRDVETWGWGLRERDSVERLRDIEIGGNVQRYRLPEKETQRYSNSGRKRLTYREAGGETQT